MLQTVKIRVIFGIILGLSITLTMAHRNLDVDRINLGVSFRYITAVRPTTYMWKHTFLVKLIPRSLSYNHHHLLVGDNSRGQVKPPFTECVSYLNNQIYPTHAIPRRDGLPANVNSSCIKHQKAIQRVIKLVKENHDSLKQLRQAIEDLTPREISHRLYRIPGLSTRRLSSRSILPGLGRLATHAFGLVNEDQLKTVVRHLGALQNYTLKETGKIKSFASDLSSMSKTLDERMDNIVKSMTNASLHKTEQFEEIQDSENDMKFELALLWRVTRLQHTMENARAHLQYFLQEMRKLAEGKLGFVTKTMLRNVFREINSKHFDTYGNQMIPFSLIYDDYQYFLNHGQFTYMREGDHLLITLNIPISSERDPFTAYHITLHPALLPGHKGAIMKLAAAPVGLAISNANTYYLLDEQDLMELYGVGKHNKLQKIMYTPAYGKDSCILAIYRGDTGKVRFM